MRTLPTGIVIVLLGGVGSSGLATLAAPIQSESARPTRGASPTRAPRLFKDSRQSIAIARAQGRRDIVLVVATAVGRTDAAAQDAARLGGTVRFRDNEAGYLRVRLPLDKATEFAELADVVAAAADYDESYPSRLMPDEPRARGEPRTRWASEPRDTGLLQAPQTPLEQWPPRAGDYPLRHPYSPTKDLDAAAFLAKNPTFDGRGVTIALLDGNMDLLLPEFQTAYTLDGTRTPKFADFLNVTDPRDDAELNPQWVNMQAEVDATSGQATFGGKTFTVPRPGKYRIGLFDERRFNDPSNLAYIDQDVDRDGNPKGDDGLFGLLWDERSNDVWVDTNRNLTFADDKPMTDYLKRHDVGVFGKDDPNTPVRESIGFTVQTDPANKFVAINLGVYQHASGIMGSVVGNRDPNGRVAGVAPGAQLVSMFYGVSNLHAAIEGLIRAYRDPRIDLIVFEQSVAMASIPYLLADARHPISVVAQRLAERYQKLMYVPGGNAPGFGIVSEDGLAPGAMSIGGYQSKDSYLANDGTLVEDDDNMHWGGMSHGPSGIGAAKPDLLAPSGQISTDVGYRKGAAKKGLFQLPPGYSIDGGTSTATPMAAGATALVVSAAKQRGLKYDATRLKAALVGSARWIPKLAAHEQGAGLVQVAAAFALLEKLQSAPMVTIVSRAPVRTRLSPLLTPANEGVGLYEREGWKVGDRGERTITLTRMSGPAEPMTFALSWVGNDGTFAGPASVVLALDRPTPVRLTIAVETAGAHSAMLTVDHPSIPGHAHRVLCTVVGSLPLKPQNRFSASTTMTVPKPADRGMFVDVPVGVAALLLSAASADGPVRMDLVSPDRDYSYACQTGASISCAVPNPTSGVWEINIANNDVSFDPDAVGPAKPKSVKVTATALGMDVEAPLLGSLNADGAVSFRVHVTNRLGGATAAIVGSPLLGSAFRTSQPISQGEQHAYEITVPKNAGSVRAKVRVVGNLPADLDLYLLDCAGVKRPSEPAYDRANGGKAPAATAPPCAPRAKAATVEGNEREVEVLDPAPGRWVVVVDAFSVPGGRATYEYLDVFTDPRLGAIVASDAPEKRESSEAWSVNAHAWVSMRPEAPRALLGRVAVTSQATVQQVRGLDLVLRPWLVPLGSLDLFFDK